MLFQKAGRWRWIHFQKIQHTKINIRKKLINNMSYSTAVKPKYLVIKVFSARQSAGPSSFMGEFYQALLEDITPILLKYIFLKKRKPDHCPAI